MSGTAEIVALSGFGLALVVHATALFRWAAKMGVWAGKVDTLLTEHDRRLSNGGL